VPFEGRIMKGFIKIPGMSIVFSASALDKALVTGMDSSLVWREQTEIRGVSR
jgi:hypothetical protein